MIPLQTEHRAFTPVGGTFAGSTRKTERQSGQLTFISELPPSVTPCEASFAFSDDARVANGGQRLLRRDAVVATPIDGVHGSRKTLSVGFHLGSKLTRLTCRGQCPAQIGDDTDRERHEWNAVEVTPADRKSTRLNSSHGYIS